MLAMRSGWLLVLVGACCHARESPPPVPETCTAATIETAPLAECERRCAAGSPAACATTAGKYCRGYGGIAPDVKQCLSFALRACERASAQGCWYAAEVYSGAGDSTTRSVDDEMRALRRMLELHERDCAAGHGPACIETATWYDQPNPKADWPLRDPERAARDLARGLELEQKSCDGGDGYACALLALEIGGNPKVTKDRARQFALTRRACELGHAPSCSDAALLPDANRDELMKRACTLGLASACMPATP